MAESLKDLGRMENETVLENLYILMVMRNMGFGLMTKGNNWRISKTKVQISIHQNQNNKKLQQKFLIPSKKNLIKNLQTKYQVTNRTKVIAKSIKIIQNHLNLKSDNLNIN